MMILLQDTIFLLNGIHDLVTKTSFEVTRVNEIIAKSFFMLKINSILADLLLQHYTRMIAWTKEAEITNLIESLESDHKIVLANTNKLMAISQQRVNLQRA